MNDYKAVKALQDSAQVYEFACFGKPIPNRPLVILEWNTTFRLVEGGGKRC